MMAKHIRVFDGKLLSNNKIVTVYMYLKKGSKFDLKPTFRPDKKNYFALFAPFDVKFFVLTLVISKVSEEKFAPQEVSSCTPNWEPLICNINNSCYTS